MTSAATSAPAAADVGRGAGNRLSLVAASLVLCSVPHTAKFLRPTLALAILVTHRALSLPTLF